MIFSKDKKQLSELEKAVLTYAAVENIKDWPRLYGIVRGEEYIKSVRPDTFATMASRWKLSYLVKDYYNNILERIEEDKRRAFEKYLQESPEGDAETHKQKKTTGFVNLLDRDDFLQYLNNKVNELQNPNEIKDFLKLISDNMRYKEERNNETNDIQRFYTPLNCKDCILYKKELENLEK